MKSKTKTYIIFLGLCCWCIVGYKIYLARNPELPEMQNIAIEVNELPKLNVETDTFTLIPISRDPFLGKLKKRESKKKNSQTVSSKQVIEIPIQYLGAISKKQSKDKVYIVAVQGIQYFVRKGSRVNDVKIVSANDNYLTIQYKGVRKRIERS